ncbi:transcription factor SPT20 homolog [Penaeus japonicus]|uniref:transcription factor SPT20 homolog n=1 Tax=Penaeus japonicus TaxID=27405 RepID=UPI001C70B53F|nr:transcription factor SPT20 homolog [Penaeus japonicus]
MSPLLWGGGSVDDPKTISYKLSHSASIPSYRQGMEIVLMGANLAPTQIRLIPDAVLTTRRLSRSEEHLQERSRGKDLHKNTRNEDLLLEQKNMEVKPEEILGTREVDSREEQQGKESNPEIKQKNESNPSEVQQNKETNPKIQENKEPNPFQEQQNKESNVSERQQNKESNPSEEQQNKQQNKESVPEIEQNKESKPTLLQGKIPSKVEELKIKETLTIKEDNKSLSQPKIISKIAKKKEGPDLSHNIDPSEISVRQDEISALKAKIERLNMEQPEQGIRPSPVEQQNKESEPSCGNNS